MLEDIRNKVKAIYENVDYAKMFEEEGMGDEQFVSFTHTGEDGKAYIVKYEPGEEEFHVFDDSNKLLDIFTPSIANQNGVLSSQVRQSIVNDYQQNHSKDQQTGEDGGEGTVQETMAVPPATTLEEEKWMQKAVNPEHKGKFTEYCKKAGFSGPCAECVAHARKSGDKHIIGMANFYANAQGK